MMRKGLVLLGFILLGIASATAQSTTTYTYDALGRLVGESTSSATTTYNYDPAGNRASVTPGTAAPTASFSANPISIAQGASTTLTWTSTGGSSAVISNGVGSVTPVAGGSVNVSPSQTQTYTLTVTGSTGLTTSRGVTIIVTPPTPAPSGSFDANPSAIVLGKSTTLSWTSANATSASIDNGIGTVTPVAGGSRTVSPTTTTTYTLTLTGPSGTVTNLRTVTVSPPPNGSLTASPAGIAPGGSSTLHWVSANALNAAIDNNIGNVTPVAGGTVTVSPTATTTYTLILTGAAGSSVSSAATVTVTAVNHPPTANPDEIDISGALHSSFNQCIDPRTNDTDPDGDTLTITGITQPSPVYATATYASTYVCISGTVTGNRTTHMTYTISDGRGGTSTATITIVISLE